MKQKVAHDVTDPHLVAFDDHVDLPALLGILERNSIKYKQT